jgi:hypothetical protein
MIPPERGAELRWALMTWRREVRAVRGTEAERSARDGVQAVKVALGERGRPWWEHTASTGDSAGRRPSHCPVAARYLPPVRTGDPAVPVGAERVWLFIPASFTKIQRAVTCREICRADQAAGWS